MPIRINLLAEEQAAEEERRRDPAKRAAIIAILAVIPFCGWAGMAFVQKGKAAAAVAEQDAALEKIAKDANLARTNLAKIKEVEGKLAKLYEMATNRVLWASALDSLQRIYVENVQVVRVRVQQGYREVPAESNKAEPKKSKPASSTEGIAVIITARDFGKAEDSNSNKFKDRIMADPWFSARLSKDKPIGATYGASTPTKEDPSKTYIEFTLTCFFNEVVR